MQSQSQANDSEMDQQLNLQQNSPAEGGLGDADPNFNNDSAIDLNGLTESEIQVLQNQPQDSMQELGEMNGNDASGLEIDDGEGEGDDDDEDVIDVDNPEDLARKGLRKIQIEGDDEMEYLMDNEGNIYDLQGNFIGTTGGDDEEGEDQDTSQTPQ